MSATKKIGLLKKPKSKDVIGKVVKIKQTKNTLTVTVKPIKRKPVVKVKATQVDLEQKSIFELGFLVDVTKGSWGGRKKLTASDLNKKQEDIPKLFSLGQKYKVAKSSFKVFTSIVNETNKFLDRYTIPFPIRGVRFVPMRFVNMVSKGLREFKNHYIEEADLFSAQGYPNAIERVKKEYPKEWAKMKDEYPSAAVVRSRFYYDYMLFTIAPPANGGGILSPDEVQAQRDYIKQQTDKFTDLYVNAIRKQIEELTVNLADRFKKGDIFKQNSIDNIMDLCKRFEDGLNIMNVDTLTSAIDNLKKMFTENNDADVIRDDEGLMRKLGTKLNKIIKDVDAGMETMASDMTSFKRKITF